MGEFLVTPALLGRSSAITPQYTGYQETVLQILALIFSSVSIISTALTFHWFLNMRRSFYHNLVMILIQSDMFKAMWYMIYAIAALSPASVETASVFCQISGFFTVTGIELSDFAVLMISVHSAIYIFKPPTSIGEGGLYPYRYIAYILSIALPLILAAIAFTNPNGAYVSGGTSCHLPVNPYWYRVCLSWVPRYLIFMFIVGADVSIYFYIRYKFGDFGKKTSDFALPPKPQSDLERQQPANNIQRSNHPPVPPLAHNGLIPETRPSIEISLAEPNFYPSDDRSQQHQAKTWVASSTSQRAVYSDGHSSVPQSRGLIGLIEALAEGPSVPNFSAGSSPVLDTSPPSRKSWTSITDLVNPRPDNNISLFSFHRHSKRRDPGTSKAPKPSPQRQRADSVVHDLNEMAQVESRKRIRQQLKSLFIYPLAYVAMWIIPFVWYVLLFDDYYATHPPFPLVVVVNLTAVIQPTVDCLIFNIKEKPWRKAVKKSGGGGGGGPRGVIHGRVLPLRRMGSGWKRLSARDGGGGVGGGRGVGKSTGAMEQEAIIAYRRRDEERAAMMTRASELGAAAGGGEERPTHRRERSWWDEIDDIDGAMGGTLTRPPPIRSIDRVVHTPRQS